MRRHREALPADWPRFSVVPSLVWDNSFNVVDNRRENERGEPFVELCAVTEEQAIARAKELNGRQAHT